MRLSPPIAVLSILAAGLAVSTLYQNEKFISGSHLSSIEVEGKRIHWKMIERNGRKYVRQSRFVAFKNGEVRFEVFDRELFSETESIVLSKTVQDNALAAAVVSNLTPRLANALAVSEIEARYARSKTRAAESDQWASDHRCTRFASHIFPDTVRFRFRSGFEDRLSVVLPGCIDDYSKRLRVRVDEARSQMALALNVNLDKPLPN